MAGHFPEEDAAHFRKRTGIERVDLMYRDTRFLPHPNVGGTRGYNIPFRQIFITDYQAGCLFLANILCSIQQWVKRILPHRMTGNTLNHGLSGQYLLLPV